MGIKQNGERLDKAISAQTAYSRKDVHKLLSKGLVQINGDTVRTFDVRFDPAQDVVTLEGRALNLCKFSYIMMNKPRGVVCATEDGKLPTVLDLLPEELVRKGLFPAGRLDKDTEGFVLITNDGELAHRILSPRSHQPKVYLAVLDQPFDEQLVQAFAEGIELAPQRKRERADDGAERTLRCMPAQLSAENGDYTRGRVVIRQGMYHQVKRMFEARGITVLALKRERIGGLELDPALEPGACRPLTPAELELLCVKESQQAV